MRVDPARAEALLAVVETGSFDAAARELHVTPSAVSQRVRALEGEVGQVLVVRAAPCRATDAGEVVLRLARQARLLAAEAERALGAARSVTLPVAVNADSLATWFREVLGAAADWEDVALALRVEDQAWSRDLLRRGEVLAAVTSDPEPVQGCGVEPLGALRYHAAAAPAFAERWRRGRSMDWAAMPLVVFNTKDRLQHDVLERHGVDVPPLVHEVPSSADFLDAIRQGLGWGVVPEPQLDPLVGEGELLVLPGRDRVDVPLHWQRWRIESELLDRLTDDVRRAARSLRRPHHGPPARLARGQENPV